MTKDFDAEAERLIALSDMGFLRPRLFGPEHWAAIVRSDPFYLIVEGDLDALSVGYRKSWSYNSYSDARYHIDRWNGTGQPQGWSAAYLGDDLTVYP